MLVSTFFAVQGATAFASIEVSEIMYDLEGADAGREWIEVRNNGGQAVDLSAWKLYENGTNHALNPVGASTVPAGGYAIIADDSDKFRAGWPGFGGILFASSFSLGNETETLTLRDGALLDIDSVTYRKEDGAAGDGLSLSRSGGGWIASAPSPGGAASSASPTPPLSSSGTTPTPPPTSYGGGGGSSSPPPVSSPSPSPPAPKMRVEIRGSVSAIAGVASEYEAVGYGLEGKELSGARYVWSFGDGARSEGEHVSHIYLYPGEYVVAVEMVSGEHSVPARLVVKAVRPSVRISDLSAGADGYVEVANDGAEELDLSGWILHSANTFTFPRGTIVLPRRTIRIANNVSALTIAASGVELLYPNAVGAASSTLGSGSQAVNKTLAEAVSPVTPQRAPPAVAKSTGVTREKKTASAPARKAVTPVAELEVKNGSDSIQEIATATLLASATDNSWPVNKWIVAFIGLVMLSILAYLFMRPPREPYTDIKILD